MQAKCNKIERLGVQRKGSEDEGLGGDAGLELGLPGKPGRLGGVSLSQIHLEGKEGFIFLSGSWSRSKGSARVHSVRLATGRCRWS